MTNAQDFWEPTNGPYNRAILSLAIDSNGFVFAGTDSGLFFSEDEGDNWIEKGLSNEIISTIAFGPNKDVFVGNVPICSLIPYLPIYIRMFQ